MANTEKGQPISSERKKLYVLAGLLGLLVVVGVWNFWPDSKPAPPPGEPRDGRVRNTDLAAQRNRPQPTPQLQTEEQFQPVAELPALGIGAVGVAISRNIFIYPPPPPPKPVPAPPVYTPPPPTINVGSISPTVAVAGTSKPIQVTVTGSEFQPDFKIYWNGRPLQTEVVNRSLLRATVQPSDIASAGTARVEVKSASQPQALWSRQLNFTLQAPPNPSDTFVYTGRIGGQAVITFKDQTKKPRLVSPGDIINGTVPWKVLSVNDARLEVLDTQNDIRKTMTLAPKADR